MRLLWRRICPQQQRVFSITFNGHVQHACYHALTPSFLQSSSFFHYLKILRRVLQLLRSCNSNNKSVILNIDSLLRSHVNLNVLSRTGDFLPSHVLQCLKKFIVNLNHCMGLEIHGEFPGRSPSGSDIPLCRGRPVPHVNIC